MTTAHARAFHGARPARIAIKAADIRKHLSPASLDAFNAELGDATDAEDVVTAVRAVKERWWGQALIETDPELKAALESAERGEMEYGPSPLPR